MVFSPRPLLVAATIAVTAAGTLTGLTQPAAAQSGPAPRRAHSTIRHQVHHDTSAPLRSMAVVPVGTVLRENEPVPRMPQRPVARQADPVVQASISPAIPSTTTNFDGLGQGFSGPQGTFSVTGVPPDPNAAVGATQVVEIVNTGFAVFSKTGTALYGPANTNTLFSGFGGACQTTNDGDAVARYDSLAGRWVITQFANVQTSGPFYECVAVSTTSDATGTWNRYSYQYSSFPDYPKLSVWPDAYYVTYNLFNAAGTSFLGAEICAMNRSAMLTGATANQQCFTTSTSYGGLLASDVDGTTAPPSGESNVVVALGTTATTLAYWKYHVDWTTTANSTFTGPSTLTVASYTTACGSTGTCVPQTGTTQQLDSLSDRLMFRLAYRNFGDHESLVVNHAVTSGSTVGVRWYELRLTSGTPSVYQQSTYAPDTTYRWMGSIATDKVGNMALGYSASSSTINPQVRFTGRLAADTLNSMTQGEGTIVAGAGHQTSYSRWGDYTSMAIDPVDGCTFWYTDEYEPATGNFNWRTRLASFQMPGCSGTTTNDFSLTPSPTSGSVAPGSSATSTVATALVSGTAETVALTASGLPTGATAAFSPTSVTAGASSTLTIATTTSTPAGTYPITITGTATSATHTATYTLTVTGTTTTGVTNGTFESALTGWTSTGTTAAVTTPVHAGAGAARIGSTSPSTDSSLAQTFTAPTAATGLRFYYRMVCPDTITYDWFIATLTDNTTSTTTTIRSKVCSTGSAYTAVTTTVTAGHSYTLTMTSHDDNYTGDASYTYVDDVATT